MTTNNNWLLLANYGDHPHTHGLQRLTAEDAKAIEKNHRTLYGRLRRAMGGIPIFVGHPDEPTLAGQAGHTDTKAYGWIHDVAAKADGLWVRPHWSAAGKKLIEGAHYKFFSPRWKLTKHADGSLRPFEIVSVGLTNNPNIDAWAITPDATDTEETAANDKKVAAKDSPLAAVAAAVGLPANTPLKELVAAVQTYAQERLAHIETMLDLAVAKGKVSAGEREEWKKKLREDFPTAANCLAVAVAKKETQMVSDTLCNCAGGEDFLQLVKRRQSQTGRGFAECWNELKHTHRAEFERLRNI